MATFSQLSFRPSRIRNFYQKILTSRLYRRGVEFIRQKPFTSFLTSLALLLAILIFGSVISKSEQKEITEEMPTKVVKIHTVGKTPTVTLQAQVEKNGIVNIVAQTSGIVQAIHLREGDSVKKGQSIVSLSTNYQGENALALQLQLASAQLKNSNETYTLQKDIISKQKDIATASAENAEQLRKISETSLAETRDLLTVNENLLTAVKEQINFLEQTNPTSPDLQSLRSQQVQLQASVNQLRSSLRSLEYQTDGSKPPTLLVNTQKEITLKQLEIQEKALDLNQAVSKIQYSLALVQESIMRPAAPFPGKVERIYVIKGQSVNPGTLIATIASANITSTVVLRAQKPIAQSISRVEPSTLYVGSETISLTPSYVSTVATDGQLYSIIYTLPDSIGRLTTKGEYIPVEVPVGYADTNDNIPYVPIDAVYESEDEASVFIVENMKAVKRRVTVGDVYGEYVQILSGLRLGDKVILNRNVIAGDKVKIEI